MKMFANVLGLAALLPVAFALWPLPKEMTQGKGVSRAPWTIVPSDHDFTGILGNAVMRYTQMINQDTYVAPLDYNQTTLNPTGELAVLNVNVESNDPELSLQTDESYELDVPESGDATIKAKTIYGAMHGLETFSQLYTYNNGVRYIKNTPIHIKDEPKFPHRGLLLDTSRNYYDVPSIKRTLDAMSYNKMNAFHWHIVDAQSWPVEFKMHPEIYLKGRYSPEMIYTHEDVRDIVQYAKERGIRVIPEFDMPGHMAIVNNSHPEIMACVDKQPDWDKFAAEPPSGQYDLSNPDSLKLAKETIKEYSELFPDKYFHVGGDEVNIHCWNTTGTIRQYIENHPGSDVYTMLRHFYDEIHSYANNDCHKNTFTWEETLFHANYTPPSHDTIVQTWIDSESIPKTVAAGYPAIASPSSFYYLDCGHGAWLDNFVEGNSWCDPFKTWMKVYSYDPLTNITDPAQQKLVLGGEVALWSEQSDDTVVDSRLWPRASAAAEILWSGAIDPATGKQRESGLATPRLHDQRFRMVYRGIQAEPMQPLWCVRHPEQCWAPDNVLHPKDTK